MTYEEKSEIVIRQLREDRDRLLDAIDNIRAEIERIDTNYYKQCNGIDMTLCAEDFKHEILQIIDKYKINPEDIEAQAEEFFAEARICGGM